MTVIIAGIDKSAETYATPSQQFRRAAQPKSPLFQLISRFAIPEERVLVAVILYIDTDQLYMSTMKLLLEGHGFKVLLARTRDHMRQVLLTHVVDLALIDHDFARELPQLLHDVRSISPLTRTVLLGMRDSDAPLEDADAYCARLQGPEKLLSVLDAAIERGTRQNVQRA